MFIIEAEKHFDSAHFLKGYAGPCANLHGHRWLVKASAASEALIESGPKRGMVMDFGDLKKALAELVDPLDHQLIYEKGSLSDHLLDALKTEGFSVVEIPVRPTAEALSKLFYDQLKAVIPQIESVTVYETPTNYACYRRP